MNIHLTPELESLVHKIVQTGRYDSASEVVREALRLMEERDEINAMQKEEIRRKIAVGVASAKAGRLTEGEPFMGQMLAELNEEARAEDARAEPERTGR